VELPKPGGPVYCHVSRVTVEGKDPQFTRNCMDYSLLPPGRIPEPSGSNLSCAEYSVSGGRAQVAVCLCAATGCNTELGTIPTTTTTTTTTQPAPTTTTTEPAPKPGALKCHKCDAIPNPGNPHPDACDGDKHFGDLRDCSVELPNPKGDIYCEVSMVTEKDKPAQFTRNCLDYGLMPGGRVPRPKPGGQACAQYSVSEGQAQVYVCLCDSIGCNTELGALPGAAPLHSLHLGVLLLVLICMS